MFCYNDDNQNMHIQQQERRRRLDPINKNVCIMKSSKDGGHTWVNFQVISFNGWKGTYFNGCTRKFLRSPLIF